MPRTFRDHFAAARGYARYRPSYPRELFDFLSDLSPGHDLAWDCATGSGQAAVELTESFTRVIATDASVGQLARAERSSTARFAAALAEAAPIADGSVDLITIAQALHWLEREAFYDEVERVAVRRGVVAAWTYPLLVVDEEVDAILHHFAYQILGRWWPPEGRHVRNRYCELPFPFEPIEAPPITSTARWSLDHLAGYIGTWSAMHRHRADTGEDPLPAFVAKLEPLWGEQRQVRWDLRLLVGRVQ